MWAKHFNLEFSLGRFQGLTLDIYGHAHFCGQPLDSNNQQQTRTPVDLKQAYSLMLQERKRDI